MVKGYINKSWCGTHQPPNLETTCKGNSKPDLRVILKVYPDTFLSKMEKEVYVYSLLDRAGGLPTPNILWSDDSKELLPQHYALMTTLEGQPLSRVAPLLSEPQIRDIYFQMGALLANVHDITLDAFGHTTKRVIDSHATNEAYMRFQFQKKLAEFEAHGGDAGRVRAAAGELARPRSDLQALSRPRTLGLVRLTR
jgi:hygromycin-B 7''-O-kinase